VLPDERDGDRVTPIDGGDLGEVVHGRGGFLAGAVDRRHPVTVSFVWEYMLRILRSGWTLRRRYAHLAVLKRALRNSASPSEERVGE
jgi:hypothetical protein